MVTLPRNLFPDFDDGFGRRKGIRGWRSIVHGEKQVSCCAAVDLGAGSGRVVIGDLHDGRLALNEVHRFETPLVQDPTGRQCWDIDAIEDHVRQGLLLANARAPIESIGIDGWGVDYVLLDGRRRRVGLPMSYRDLRTEGMMRVVGERISQEEIYRRTGVQFLSFNSLYQLAATEIQNPEWLKSASHFLMIPDYLNFRLCGVIENEYTNATTTQLYSALTNDWDADLLAAAGLARPLMRPVVEPGSGIGTAFLGERAIRVVAVASHDTASAVVGAPLGGEDDAFISSGTWSLMGVESPVPILSDEARRLNFSNEGGYGRRYRILKNITGLWLLQRVRAELARPGLNPAECVAAAQGVEAWRSLIDPGSPHFLNPPSMIRAIQGYCAETGQPVPEDAGALARCIFDSLALSYRRVKEELEALRGRALSHIRIVGGGSRNGLLDQLCADACQLPVDAGPTETSALGNICVQMISAGAIQDLDAARAIVRRSFPCDQYLPGRPVPEPVWRRFQAFTQSF